MHKKTQTNNHRNNNAKTKKDTVVQIITFLKKKNSGCSAMIRVKIARIITMQIMKTMNKMTITVTTAIKH